MSKENAITIFEQKKVRTHWDEEKELWFISVIDVIEVLTGTDRPRKYWNDLKVKLKKEGSELSEKIGQLKMIVPDGKMQLTNAPIQNKFSGSFNLFPHPKQSRLKTL